MGTVNHANTTPFEAESTTLINAMSVTPTATRQGLIDECIRGLKKGGVWTLLDVFYMFAADAAQAALLNWKNPGTFNATNVNSTVFTADAGYTFTGTSNHRIQSYNPSTAGGNYTQNSASGFVWINSAAPTTPDGGAAGYGKTTVGGNQQLFMYPRAYGPPLNSIGTTTDITSYGYNTEADARGLHHFTRTGAAAEEEFLNGKSTKITTDTSAAVENDTVSFGMIQTAERFTGVMLGGGFGGGMTAAQHACLYNSYHIFLMKVAGVA